MHPDLAFLQAGKTYMVDYSSKNSPDRNVISGDRNLIRGFILKSDTIHKIMVF